MELLQRLWHNNRVVLSSSVIASISLIIVDVLLIVQEFQASNAFFALVLAVAGPAVLSILWHFISFTEETTARLKRLATHHNQGATKPLHNTEECISEIVWALEKSHRSLGNRLVIKRVANTEFTSALFKDPQHIAPMLERYDTIMRKIIQSGQGVWDYSIYGRVNDPRLNEETVRWINRTYFRATPDGLGDLASDVDSSDLGFDPHHNQTYFLLIGQLRQEGTEDVEKWLWAFLIYADHRLRPTTGIMTQDEPTIGVLSEFWRTAKRQCKADENNDRFYWRLDLCQHQIRDVQHIMELGILTGDTTGAPRIRW
jgi:hypothetical protein